MAVTDNYVIRSRCFSSSGGAYRGIVCGCRDFSQGFSRNSLNSVWIVHRRGNHVDVSGKRQVLASYCLDITRETLARNQHVFVESVVNVIGPSFRLHLTGSR